MKVLVAYASERGGTAEIAEWIGAELLGTGVDAQVSPAGDVTTLDGFDAVVLGGALYGGRWHREARHFVRHHAGALADRPVWLFSSGPLDHSAEEGEIGPVPGVAKFARRVGARGHATFGGRLDPGARGFVASRIAQRAGGDFRDRDHVRAWTDAIAEDLRAVSV
ncbi:flavodoxin domain-containing protein [Actinomadura sp. NPDC048394]|jgi:menaquinone-dependent protoporphyrinogen oxidase|uniref:flavodoxin domain-containing protein n=1 Tax=Actinomadura sp. NPDC048394 TaxID=3158223 RepID=UPI0033FDF754